MAKKISEVEVDKKDLMQKGYNAKDLLGKTFEITSIKEILADDGDEYLSCEIKGEGFEAGKHLVTGAKNIVARLRAAVKGNHLPVEVTVVSLGGNALDIE